MGGLRFQPDGTGGSAGLAEARKGAGRPSPAPQGLVHFTIVFALSALSTVRAISAFGAALDRSPKPLTFTFAAARFFASCARAPGLSSRRGAGGPPPPPPQPPPPSSPPRACCFP